MVQMSTLKTLNDFMLLQLAWVYDLNFTGSLRMVAERRYIEMIAALLPATGEVRDAVNGVRDYVERQMG
jgi:hypothetical protein